MTPQAQTMFSAAPVQSGGDPWEAIGVRIPYAAGEEIYAQYVVKCSDGTDKTISTWDNRKSWCQGTGLKEDCDRKQIEAAKKACGQCNESGQAIAYFNLGIAYAQAKRNSEAIQQLASFDKIICKGAAATRYADQCAQSSQFGAKLNGAGGQ